MLHFFGLMRRLGRCGSPPPTRAPVALARLRSPGATKPGPAVADNREGLISARYSRTHLHPAAQNEIRVSLRTAPDCSAKLRKISQPLASSGPTRWSPGNSRTLGVARADVALSVLRAPVSVTKFAKSSRRLRYQSQEVPDIASEGCLSMLRRKDNPC